MAISDKVSLKSRFETGDRPTQADFESLLDTAIRDPLVAIATAAEGGKTGLVEILSTATVTAHASAGALPVTVEGSGAAARTLRGRFRDVFNVKDFGARGDTKHLEDGRMAAGSAVLESSAATFTGSDVGKRITVSGANVSAHGLIGSISAFLSAHGVRIDVTAQTSGNAFRVDYGTNDTPAIQRTYAHAAEASGAVVWFPPGGYVMTSAVDYPDKVATKGTGMGATTIYQFATARVFEQDDGADRAWASIEDLTIKGMWNLIQTQGGDEDRHITLFDFDRLTIRNVESLFCRQMAITGRANEGLWVEGCRVLYAGRDGINMSGSKGPITVRNNHIRHAFDDAISIHVTKAQGNPPRESVIVSDNHVEDALGIKILGAVKTIISNNIVRRAKGYSAFVGFSSGSQEGLNDETDVLITGNVFTDVVNLTAFAAGDVGYHIALDALSPSTAGTVDEPPGQPDRTNDLFVAPETYYLLSNNTANGSPHSGGWRFRVTNNIFAQTLPAVTAYSQWGYGAPESGGKAFHKNGWTDPSLLNYVPSQFGMLIGGGGVAQHLEISNNMFSGFKRCIRFEGPDRVWGVWITNNRFIRFVESAISQSHVTFDESVNVHLLNNYVDADPFFEHANRNSAANDGTWNFSGSRLPNLIDAVGWKGVVIRDNTLRNLYSQMHADGATEALIEDNLIIAEVGTSAGNSKGIRDIFDPVAQKYITEDSDLTSSTYGQVRNIQDPSATSIPTSGHYVEGHFVRNQNLSISGSRVLAGWLRLTTGAGHTKSSAAADWAEIHWNVSAG